MFDKPVIYEEKPEILGAGLLTKAEESIPTILLVGSGRALHPVLMAKLLALEAACEIRIVHYCLEYVEPVRERVMTWFDECSRLPSPYVLRYGEPVIVKERKPKPYYRTKERY